MFASALPRVQQAHLHSPDHKSLNLTSVPLPLERSFRYLAGARYRSLVILFPTKVLLCSRSPHPSSIINYSDTIGQRTLGRIPYFYSAHRC